MVGTTCRISSRNIRYSAEHSEFHFNIWLFGYAHITNPNIYIYISRILQAGFTIVQQLSDDIQTIICAGLKTWCVVSGHPMP